ncbi:LysR family transcriptional regulator [Mesorhizobium sp. VK25A]|uniref:LysR family transcriptional regulator n=1 Tax=Mesorhizobium vachelliae TaxID=3072309 RepID=A0ABU5A541_9HYPH|nr:MULTISPECIES: LysR family transcriptional regulator [unclassified Mesorhizobium]MDX8532778.1 LysR family transcriptional regulator [Mesorhizobium sp. VK25D]MDX8544716.1 LysR family transcriptional regulator [Mesorhizobium sp. VK25A]
MPKPDINDLLAFMAVARERSFTRAAAQLGVSQSALSHTIRRVETALGLRLLARTTRSVALTEAGERLVNGLGHHFEDIDRELDNLTILRDKPSGTLRINAGEHAVRTVIWPKLDLFLTEYPEIKVEVHIDNGYVDIVAGRYDAGVRLGGEVAGDMIAVRIGPDWRMAVVATPAYWRAKGEPRKPHDLTRHNCMNLRLPTHGGFYAWEFERDSQKISVRVDGQLAFNSSVPILVAALRGHGVACIPEDMAEPHLREGTLQRVLTQWCPRFTGYHLYYPSRRQASPAFQLLVDVLRERS